MLAVNDVPSWDASKYKGDPEDKAFNDVMKDLDTKESDQNTQNGNSVQFENKISINGATAIPAKKGVSLLAIATDNNIKLSKLLEFNDMEKDGLLEKDQLIFLEKNQKKEIKLFT